MLKISKKNVKSLLIIIGIMLMIGQVSAFDVNNEFEGEADVSNISPVFSVTVSDGGSYASAPTVVGNNVTFTATAKDINSDQYYLAICKTNAVTAGDDSAPSCDTNSTWAVSSAVNSDSQATVTYTSQSGDTGSNNWFAFVCDKLPTVSGPLCFPANGSADQGLAIGLITLSGIPADTDSITVDGITYEFDTNSSVTGGNTAVNIASAASESDVASALAASEAGTNSHMVSRANFVFIYADSSGAGGNSIGIAEVQDTNSYIAISGSNLVGGNDANKSPFTVVGVGTFGSVTVTDDTDGTIAPGDTLKFKLPTGNVDSWSNVNMYICSDETTAFDYVSDSCTGGTLICSSLNASISSDISCTGGASLVSAPTAHGNYSYKIYVEDAVNTGLTGTNSQSYSVIDVPPVLVEYSATDVPNIPAGGNDTMDLLATISDANGDNDITAVDGVFFENTSVDNNCNANEQNCYIISSCIISDVSTPGTGKTVTGTDAQITATCSAQLWFNTLPSANWEVHVNPTDGLGRVTDFADSNLNVNIDYLAALSVQQASIAYGSVAVGLVSDRQTTSIENMGNTVIDILISGTDMCPDYPTCAGSVLLNSQQKWYHLDSDFNWSSAVTNPGPYTLIGTGSLGVDDATGCLNRDIAVRSAHDSSSTDEPISWKLKIPNGQAIGIYSGQNVFTSTASNTCTGGQSY